MGFSLMDKTTGKMLVWQNSSEVFPEFDVFKHVIIESADVPDVRSKRLNNAQNDLRDTTQTEITEHDDQQTERESTAHSLRPEIRALLDVLAEEGGKTVGEITAIFKAKYRN